MYDFNAVYEAQSVPHAISLLSEHPGARVLAGGSDIFIKVREGSLAGCEAVSIFNLDELRGVSADADGAIRILPLTSFSRVAESPVIKERIPVLGEAAGVVGGPQIRNIGTIGGNICNGATSADCASTLFAYDAVLELTGPEGVRRLPVRDFYISAGKVALGPCELLTAIILPKDSYENCFGRYIKYSMREAMDIATLGCSVNVRLTREKDYYDRVRVAFGVAGPVPARAFSAEAAVNGMPVNEAAADGFGAAVLSDISPRTSWRASKEFRLHIAREIAKRALTDATRRAGGEV